MDVFSADWLEICRRIVDVHRRLFELTPSREARTEYEGVGEGGDRSLVIDRRCEDAVFAELEQLAAAGGSFVAISEERGEVEFGEGGPARVVIDPIDGSLNARRTLPSHSLSIAVASGSSMRDVEFGYVYDFGAGEEFIAARGEGAQLDGHRAEVAGDGEKLELVGVESAEPERLRPVAEALGGRVYRLRVTGSIAITAAYVAAGRLDGMLSLRPCRSVDAAAAQLIVREAGGAIAFGDLELSEADLGLAARYPIVAAAGEHGLGTLRNALGEAV
ncbi:MAG TPA: inositol monophosphatase family protein [Solirubrobacterales bacterium]|nr:inositol monophosphatase family protein [Solirubrobacterales bacterium]